MACSVTLPFPVSLNNAFVQIGRRRIKTQRYERWRRQAGLMILSARLPKSSGPVRVAIRLVPPNNRRRDADNLVKPILDALVEAGALPGDDQRHVRKVEVEWVLPADRLNCRAEVSIEMCPK